RCAVEVSGSHISNWYDHCIQPEVLGKRGHDSVAEPTPSKDFEPPIMYRMKKTHKPEHWQFMRLHPKDDYLSIPQDALTSDHAAGAYCLRCQCLVSYAKGQTSTVARHMVTYHQAEIEKFNDEHRSVHGRKIVSKHSSTTEAPDKLVVKITREQQKRANTLLAKWLAKSQRPFSLVQDSGFLDYIKFVTLTLSGLAIDVPSRNGIAGEVRLLAVQLRATLKEQLSKACQYYCLTTDIWTDRSMRSYMAVTLHYLDEMFNMFDWTLEVEAFPGKHTGAAIAAALETVLARWGLEKSYCMRLVRDGASNAVSAGNHIGVLHTSCLAHSLHLVVSGAMMKTKADREAAAAAAVSETPNVSPNDNDVSDIVGSDDDEYEANVASVITQLQEGACSAVEGHIESRLADEKDALSKMRAIVQVFRCLAVYFRKSAKAKNRFLKIRKVEQPGCMSWLQTDCPTRWSSSHAMLTRFVELKATVENFFAYLDTPLGKQEFGRIQQQQPTQEQWLAIECLVLLLDPFAAVTAHLGGSRYPTLVAAVPALRYIKSDLKDEHLFDQKANLARNKTNIAPVISLMHRVRCALLQMFLDRFSVQDTLLQWSSYLDPRFAEMNHLEPDEIASAQQRLIDAAVEVAKTQAPREDHQLPSADPQILSPEKNMSRLMATMYGGKSKTKPTSLPGARISDVQLRKRCESEFVLFLKDAELVSLKQDPLDWWRDNAPKYPILAVLARQWLCCVATSVPSERAFSRGGNVVTAKRCALSPETVRDTIFIAENS
ncbi:hypothetical protein BBJ28_00011704, partial [Nothophytophthora sp. Chile5]